MNKLHINCDMAESYGNFKTGDDFAILPYVDAVNIACGFHGGDALTIEKTIREAIRLGKQIGAHPSYPDLEGFGRRYMEMSDDELSACLRYQICVIKSISESLGGKLHHVKAHGALYNRAAVSVREASIISKVVSEIDRSFILFAPLASELFLIAQKTGLRVMGESFADRRYDDKGQMVNRKFEHAVIQNPQEILNQVRHLVDGDVETTGGKLISLLSDTICLHGDHPQVISSLELIRSVYK